MSGTSWVSWLWRPAGAVREIGWGDIALASVLSVFAVLIVTSAWPGSSDHGGIAAAIAVLAMTVPVAWERRAPLGAAFVVAVGAVGNEFGVGAMVRCGPGVPAVLVIAYFGGTRLDPRRLALATVLCAGAVTTQSFYDPKLGPSFVVVGLPAVAGAVVAGRLVRSRGLAAAALRQRNAELRAQREQTVQLAVAADRARMAGDLGEFLRDRVTAMADATAAGRELIDTDPAGAQQALAVVAASGRETLSQMRDVVGNLRASERGPQPVLAELGALLDNATTADARLHVTGSPQSLPAGLELSAYRIVEHLLEVLQDAPEARIDVRVRFSPDALELDVAGPESKQANPVTAFATARERVALLGGTLNIESAAGHCTVLVRLPLTAGYAPP
jgi:signal transduction histidine kinase